MRSLPHPLNRLGASGRARELRTAGYEEGDLGEYSGNGWRVYFVQVAGFPYWVVKSSISSFPGELQMGLISPQSEGTYTSKSRSFLAQANLLNTARAENCYLSRQSFGEGVWEWVD